MDHVHVHPCARERDKQNGDALAEKTLRSAIRGQKFHREPCKLHLAHNSSICSWWRRSESCATPSLLLCISIGCHQFTYCFLCKTPLHTSNFTPTTIPGWLAFRARCLDHQSHWLTPSNSKILCHDCCLWSRILDWTYQLNGQRPKTHTGRCMRLKMGFLDCKVSIRMGKNPDVDGYRKPTHTKFTIT